MTKRFDGIEACVFDAYGTLLDFNNAVTAEGASLGRKSAPFSELWRRKQLEYTWLRSLMQRHEPFWQVTGDALDFTMEAFRINNPELRERLMEAYRTLAPYPEVPKMLTQLKASGMVTAILSNGSPQMLHEGVEAAGLTPHLDHQLSVEEVGVFKPSPKVYQLATQRLGVPASAIAFMSSNGWDIHGAASFGFSCIWINRGGGPQERLPGGPAIVLQDLTALPDLIGSSA